MARPDPERLELWWALGSARDRVVVAVAERLDDECDLSLPWFTVLDQLYTAGGRLRLVIEKMTEADLLDRVPTPDDGRGAQAVLTREGRARYRAALPVFRRAVQQAFARHLTDSDVVALQRVLPKLTPGDGEPG